MIIYDPQGRPVRFPEERWEHICTRHPEMATARGHITETVMQPERTVIPDNAPEAAIRYYKWFTDMGTGNKWVRVAVKYLPNDAYVITAFMTGRVRWWNKMKEEENRISIWLDEEGNALTVSWGSAPGYYTDTDEERVLVRLDMAGNVLGFHVDNLKGIKDHFVEARHGIEWWDQLGKDKRGSRPRCILLMDGGREEVAGRLTELVNVPEVEVCPDDRWMPWGKPKRQANGEWDKTPAREAEIDKSESLAPTGIKPQLRNWWLAVPRNATSPNWDIASTCTVRGKPGLLLVEAKAHAKELAHRSDKCGSTNWANRERIGQAIEEAAAGLRAASEGPWKLSRDHHYQLSNRFAWAWKLASLGIPVVLVYLGFLDAQDMAGNELFKSGEQWEQCLKEYGQGIVDNSAWGSWLDIGGTPLLPLIRHYEQPFYP